MDNKVKVIVIKDIGEVDKILSSLNKSNVNYKKFVLRGLNNVHREQRNIIFWKTIGLIISDGNFSQLIKGIGSVSFGGLSYDTAVAVVKTLIQIIEKLTLTVKRKGGIYYNVYIPSINVPNSLKQKIISLLIELDNTPSEVLSELKMEELAALLAGIIDGDGYIGKPSSYLSISFNLSSKKGKIVNEIISYLEKKGYIIISKYYYKPKYEATFKFSSFQFMTKCFKYIYNPKRKKRMEKYITNYIRNYICPFSISELEQILRFTSSAYIDYRKTPRKSKVLVLYIKPSNFEKIAHIWGSEKLPHKPVPIHNKNRIMIKITEKCKENLFQILNKGTNNIECKIIKIIKNFLEIN